MKKSLLFLAVALGSFFLTRSVRPRVAEAPAITEVWRKQRDLRTVRPCDKN